MRHLLEFTQDGSRIVVRGHGGLTIIDVRGVAPPRDLAVPDLHAFATVGDQLWVVAGAPPRLTAYTREGVVLGTVAVSGLGPEAQLHHASNSQIASWSGVPITTIASGQTLVATERPIDVDFAVPLSSTRALIASRQRLSLRDQDTPRWTISLAHLGTITDAKLVFDGKAVAIVVRGQAQAIVVIGLRDGAILHRITVGHDDVVRFAATRGVALICAPDSRLALVDLRFGRVMLSYKDTQDISAIAIDDSGREIAMLVRGQADAIVQVSVAALLAAATAPVEQPTEELVPVAEVTPAPPADAPVAVVENPFRVAGSLACAVLPERLALEPATPAEVMRLDEVHRELAIAIVAAAIARAWDEGRLAYPQTAGLPFQSEVSGLTSGQRGLALDELAASRQRLDEVRATALEVPRAIAPRLGPLDAIEHEHGLSEIARDLLLLIAAPALWGETARLYGILSNDDGRPLVDELLLAELLAERASRSEVARELDDDAPLIRQGIVRVHAGAMRPFLPLVIEPVVLRLLRGTSVTAELAPLTHARAADRTFDALRIPTATKQQLVEDLARASAPLRIVVRGRVGSGRHTLLAALATANGRQLGVVDASTLVRDPRRIGELAVAIDRAHLAGLLPCIDGLELVPSSDVATRDQVRELLRRHVGPLAVRLPGDAQPALDPGYVQVDLPVLSLSDRLTCWERTLADYALHVGELGELADRYAIGPGVIQRVGEAVADAAAQSGIRQPDAGLALDTAIRQHLESRLGGSADRITRLASWGQIVLPPEIQDSLTELIARIKHRRIVFDTWGFDRLLSTSRGVTALFQGGPGTGKTLVASAIANELGMDLYRVDLSRVMSKWIGETEQNLARLFDAAEDGNTIILFDEADSLFAKRTEVKSSVDRYANLEVNFLLQRIDSFEGIAILTTNFGTSIDSAFKRRLSMRLTFPFPDEDMREKLWRAHLPAEMPTAGDFDLTEISRKYQISGGYIRNVALRAAFLAAEEHSFLTQEHLERAIKAEFREIGKIADSGVLE